MATKPNFIAIGARLLQIVGGLVILLALALLTVGIWREVDPQADTLAREWRLIPDSTNHTRILSDVDGARDRALSAMNQELAQALEEIRIARDGGTPAAALRNNPPALVKSPGWFQYLWAFLAHTTAILLTFTSLLLIGLTLFGLAIVLKAPEPPKDSKGRTGPRPWKRFWWEGCEAFATGIRVVFLIPLSLAVWLGIVAAFHVVWQQAPSQQLENVETADRPVGSGEMEQSDKNTPGPLDPRQTRAEVPKNGLLNSGTTIVVWPRDAKGLPRREPQDTGALQVVIRLASGKTDRPSLHYHSNGSLATRYTPRALGTDTIYIQKDMGKNALPVSIDTVDNYPSRVRLPGALPLTQAQNLWFLPVAIMLGWMLLWPSEPEDETRKIGDAERTAWMNSLSKLFDAVRDAIANSAEKEVRPWVRARIQASRTQRDNVVQALKAAIDAQQAQAEADKVGARVALAQPAQLGQAQADAQAAQTKATVAAQTAQVQQAAVTPPTGLTGPQEIDLERELGDFRKEVLRSFAFTDAMSTPVLGAMAEMAVAKDPSELKRNVIVQLSAWWQDH